MAVGCCANWPKANNESRKYYRALRKIKKKKKTITLSNGFAAQETQFVQVRLHNRAMACYKDNK